METSAKDGTNIQKAFDFLLKEIIPNIGITEPSTLRISEKSDKKRKKKLKIKRKQSSCCG